MAKHIAAERHEEALPGDIAAALFEALVAPRVPEEQAARIRGKIAAGMAERPAAAVTHRLSEGEWQPLSPGFAIKIVNYDAASGLYSYLGRLQPGASIRAHSHHTLEECVIVSGDIEVEGMTLGVGDYQVFQSGTAHGVIHSRRGAVLFLRSELHLPR